MAGLDRSSSNDETNRIPTNLKLGNPLHAMGTGIVQDGSLEFNCPVNHWAFIQVCSAPFS
jgi:hypothetical protein